MNLKGQQGDILVKGHTLSAMGNESWIYMLYINDYPLDFGVVWVTYIVA